ncbi:hypothetical protein BH20ACI4_BH20ACI4_30600 [soil metagenome]
MSIYINKNNQQIGPFEEAKVLEMLQNGELSPNDLAIRQGDKKWQKLDVFYPNAGNIAPANIAAAVEQPAPKKSRKGLLMGCGGFFIIALLVAGVLGFLAYRNLYPADSMEDLPDKVGDLKLNNRYPPKGNVWGTETNFVGLYGDESKTKTVLYLMTVFSDETTAKDAMRAELVKSCQTGETPMYFSFKKGGVETSQGATCAVPLYVQKGNKLVAIGGSGASADTFIEFAENLPFNQGATMIKKTDK